MPGVVQLVAGDCLDRQRHIAQGLLALLGGHDDFLERSIVKGASWACAASGRALTAMARRTNRETVEFMLIPQVPSGS